MNRTCSMIRLLMAEDDSEDQMLVRKAFAQAHLANDLTIVNDGEELLDYLRRQPPYEQAPRPDLLLLDLNMPRKDGREALREIKSDPLLRTIPVIVLTTSAADEDILRSYDLGVNSYVEKPVTFPKLVDLVTELGKYWFKIVRLPPRTE